MHPPEAGGSVDGLQLISGAGNNVVPRQGMPPSAKTRVSIAALPWNLLKVSSTRTQLDISAVLALQLFWRGMAVWSADRLFTALPPYLLQPFPQECAQPGRTIARA